MIMAVNHNPQPTRHPGLAIIVQIDPKILDSTLRDSIPQGVVNCIADDMFDVKQFKVELLDGELDEAAIRQSLSDLKSDSPALTLVVENGEKAERLKQLCEEAGVLFRSGISIAGKRL